MSTEVKLRFRSASLEDTKMLAAALAKNIKGTEVIELTGDLGSGKTAFTRLLMDEIGTKDEVSSPSFTVENIYKTDTYDVHHYDFHRLDDPGIMLSEIDEVLSYGDALVIVEWAGIVDNALPEDRMILEIAHGGDDSRKFTLRCPGNLSHLVEGLDAIAS